MKELVAEIAAASAEQSQGVDQVNKAVNEMNHVTQQTAANAEESASASEELNAQAEQMKGFVAELTAIVGGQTIGFGQERADRSKTSPLPGALRNFRHALRYRGRDRKLLAQPQQKKPEQVIPLDDEHFQDV